MSPSLRPVKNDLANPFDSQSDKKGLETTLEDQRTGVIDTRVPQLSLKAKTLQEKQDMTIQSDKKANMGSLIGQMSESIIKEQAKQE